MDALMDDILSGETNQLGASSTRNFTPAFPPYPSAVSRH